MSSTLTKRLFRAAESTSTDRAERPSKRKRKEDAEDKEPPVSEEEIVASHIRQMLALDKKLGASSKAMRKINLKQKEQAKVKKIAGSAIVTNSRSAALQSTVKHEKTSNKKAYRKEVERKRLQKIAQKLKTMGQKK